MFVLSKIRCTFVYQIIVKMNFCNSNTWRWQDLHCRQWKAGLVVW